MTDWQQKDPKYPPSKFAINFLEDHPELFPHLSENGYLKAGKEYSDGKNTYRVKEITSKKDNKKYTLVEQLPLLGDKSPEQIAHEATNRDYADGAKRGHEENLKAWTAQTEAVNHQNEILAALVTEVRRLATAMETIAKQVELGGFK